MKTKEKSDGTQVYYDDSGNKIGESRREKEILGVFGDEVVVYYDANGREVGKTKNEKEFLGLFGDEVEVHRDAADRKIGKTKNEKDFPVLGDEVSAHRKEGGEFLGETKKDKPPTDVQDRKRRDSYSLFFTSNEKDSRENSEKSSSGPTTSSGSSGISSTFSDYASSTPDMQSVSPSNSGLLEDIFWSIVLEFTLVFHEGFRFELKVLLILAALIGGAVLLFD